MRLHHPLTGEVLLKPVLGGIVRELCYRAVKLIVSRTGRVERLELEFKGRLPCVCVHFDK